MIECCDKCKEFKFIQYGGSAVECQCKEFIIINEDGDEYKVYAQNEQNAAEKYAKTISEAHDHYLLEKSVIITVNDISFLIEADLEITYSANQIPN